MIIDTSKLLEAHAKVVDLAHRESLMRDENELLRQSAAKVQAEIDAIAEQLIAAATSPAEVAGINAVADAIDPVAALNSQAQN